MQLRDYQQRCVDANMEAFGSYRSVLNVAATGTGKTVMAGHTFKRFFECPEFSGLGLWLAHREELIIQARDKFQAVLDGGVEMEMAEYKANYGNGLLHNTQVVVASVQSLAQVTRLKRYNPKLFGLIGVDEAHHCVKKCKTYSTILDYFIEGNPDVRIFGVTATPDRADEAALGQRFEHCAFDYGAHPAILDGWLVPIAQRQIFVQDLDFSGVKSRAGDMAESEVEAIMTEEKILHRVVTPTVEIAGDRPTIFFTAGVKQAHLSADVFNRHKPGSAVAMDGKTDPEIRRRDLRRFQRGEFQYLVNCGLFLEGFDSPRVACVAVARPTESRALYSQIIGRGTRPLPGIVDGLASPAERRAAIASSGKPCIAEGQLVLTDHGLLAIESVTLAMKVWDGVEFVSHDGVVFKGVRDVVEYAGLIATPDHKVWIHDETCAASPSQVRRAFGECAAEQIAIRVTESEGHPVREADGCFRRGHSREWSPEAARPVRLRRAIGEGLFKLDRRQSRMPIVLGVGRNPGVAAAPGDQRAATVLQSEGRPLFTLRRQGDRVQVREPARDGSVGDGEPRTAPGNGAGSDRQRRPLRAGKHSIFQSRSANGQHVANGAGVRVACLHACEPRGQVFGATHSEAASIRPLMGSDIGAVEAAETPRPIHGKARVFDIVNAGPRRRFTVSGLLVSNCVLVIDYVGNAGKHKLVHSTDVLGGNFDDDVIEEARRATKKKSAQGELIDTLEALEEARKAVEERRRRQRAQIIAKASYTQRDIDPFDLFDCSAVRQPGYVRAVPATERQLAWLKARSVPNVNGLTQAQASKLIETVVQREKDGLCTPKQAALLASWGKPTDVTQDQAKTIIGEINAMLGQQVKV